MTFLGCDCCLGARELARVELEGRRLHEDVASARSLDLFVSLTSPLSRADAMEGVAIADLTG